MLYWRNYAKSGCGIAGFHCISILRPFIYPTPLMDTCSSKQSARFGEKRANSRRGGGNELTFGLGEKRVNSRNGGKRANSRFGEKRANSRFDFHDPSRAKQGSCTMESGEQSRSTRACACVRVRTSAQHERAKTRNCTSTFQMTVFDVTKPDAKLDVTGLT